MSSADEKNFKRYTAELKAAGLLDGRGRVLSDAIICRNLGYDDVETKKFLDIKKARAQIIYDRARERAKEMYEGTKRKTEEDLPAGKRVKPSSSSSSNPDEESNSSSEPGIKTSATPPDDDEETTESCNFCGGAECTICERMRGDIEGSLFIIRVCAVYNHIINPRFKTPLLTTAQPNFYHMVEFARLANEQVEVTQTEFNRVASYQDCRYCGCLMTEPGAVIKSKGPVIQSNLVPCCMLCSMIKVDVPDEEFTEQCKRIVGHLRKCPVPCTRPFLDLTHSCADHYYGFLPEK
jgi:hypothetical protein